MHSLLEKMLCFLGDLLLEGEPERVGDRNSENVCMSLGHSDGTNMQEASATLTYILPSHAIVSVITDVGVPWSHSHTKYQSGGWRNGGRAL